MYKLLDWLQIDKIDIKSLCENKHPGSISILEKHLDKMTFPSLCELSRNPTAIDLLLSHPEKINWDFLSQNPAAIQLLRAHPEKIHWGMLSRNPAAIEMLRANPEMIGWSGLSTNPAAMEILEKNRKKLDGPHYPVIRLQ